MKTIIILSIQMILLLLLLLLLLSCRDGRNIKYSGFDDLVVGSETINLFENGEFEFELGIGYSKGTYEIKNDTIYFKYNETNTLPNKMVIRNDKFESINYQRKITINRTDNIQD